MGHLSSQCVATLTLVLAARVAGGNEFVLAEGGRAACDILIPGRASDGDRFAADELAFYLRRISGAMFPVRSGPPDSARQAIILARQDAAVPPGEPAFPALPGEGYALGIRAGHLWIVGADVRGLLYGVYRVLEEQGCRWLAPGLEFYAGAHEVVPRRERVVIRLGSDLVERPALRFRKLYVEEGLSHDEAGLRRIIEWMPKLRYNTLVVPMDYQGRGRVCWDRWRAALTPELQRRGITVEVGGHGYQNFLNADMEDGRLFREHPEWFGMDESGRRTRSRGRVFCTSNAEATAYVRDAVLRYLKARPEIEVFDFWPPDGARWCTCAPCQALGGPPERHARLVSEMAAALRAELPQVRLECIAYASYLEPPRSVRIDESVLVDFCPIAQCFESQIDDPRSPANARYAEALRAWRRSFGGQISIYSYYRKYAWSSRPILLPHYMQADLRFYRRVGVAGISTYAEPGDWGTYEVNHYMLGRLAWAPDAAVDRLLDEYVRARYGPAEREAATAIRTLEQVAPRACNIPGTSLKSPAEYDAFAEQIAAAAREVEKARRRIVAHGWGPDPSPETEPTVSSAPADVAVRVAALRRLALMIEYVSRDIAIQRHRAAGGAAEERRRLVDEMRAFLCAHSTEGVFVLHGRLEPEHLYPAYGIPPPGQTPAAAERKGD